MPLMAMTFRSEAVTQDDLLFSLSRWKYYVVYLVVRASVQTEQHVRNCLWVSMSAASIVGLIAILQALGWFAMPEFLAWYYRAPPAAAGARGTSTLALAHAVADVMVFNLVIAAGLLVHGDRHRAALLTLSTLFVFGVLATGTVSGAMALLIGIRAFGCATRRLDALLPSFPLPPSA